MAFLQDTIIQNFLIIQKFGTNVHRSQGLIDKYVMAVTALHLDRTTDNATGHINYQSL